MFFTFFHIHFGVCLTNCIGPHCQTEGNKGGVGNVLEFKGAGVALFSVFERATICNMGARSRRHIFSIFQRYLPSFFLKAFGRKDDWHPVAAEEGATYDEELIIDLFPIAPR